MILTFNCDEYNGIKLLTNGKEVVAELVSDQWKRGWLIGRTLGRSKEGLAQMYISKRGQWNNNRKPIRPLFAFLLAIDKKCHEWPQIGLSGVVGVRYRSVAGRVTGCCANPSKHNTVATQNTTLLQHKTQHCCNTKHNTVATQNTTLATQNTTLLLLVLEGSWLKDGIIAWK